MTKKTSSIYFQRLKFISVLLFIYLSLFEFILLPVKILPRPSILLESLIAVWGDYNFLFEMSVSTFIIYGAMILAYLVIFVLRTPLIKIILNAPGSLELFRVFRFFPAFFYAVIFAYWFPGSIFAELIFVLIAILFYLFVSMKENISRVNKNHLLVAQNLGISAKQKISEITWKELQPGIFNAMKRMHYIAWILVLLFEYIGDYAGIGHVYSSALGYNDFAGLFSIAIYIAILILAGDSLVSISKRKIVYWDK